MLKHKVGDQVKVRYDLVVGQKYGCDIFLDKMEKCKGQTFIIKAIWDENHFGEYLFGLHKNASDDYGWTDEMLEDDIL